MTTTTNYGYTVVVGSDTPVNIQNDIAPNFTAIDTDLKAVSDSAITVATHTVSGTVHNLVRADADRDVMYFVATGDMASGDTFTVDGVTVTARLANGEALATGSFKINNTVMGILVGTVLNLQVPGATATASGTTYDNTGSGLTATNVQDAIDEVVSDIPTGFSATAISYNNTISGLSASDVQYAIDELASFNSFGIKATANAGQTFVTQLTSLELAFNNLTTEQKLKSILLRSDGMEFVYMGSGIYNCIRMDASACEIDQYNILAHTAVRSAVRPNNTYSDFSTATDAYALTLYA